MKNGSTGDCIEKSTPWTDHDLRVDHPVPHLPLRGVGQDLHSTDPTQETRARSLADHTAPTRQHELDHAEVGNRYIYLERSRSGSGNG